jgi:hypothetical protein
MLAFYLSQGEFEMIKEENLLVTLMEECAEVQQAVAKALRFGLHRTSPSDRKTNADLIMTEYYQLIAVMETLVNEGVLPRYYSKDIEAIKVNKKEKVWNYQELSKTLGCIREE